MKHPGMEALVERRERLATLDRHKDAGEWGVLMHPDADEFIGEYLDYAESWDLALGNRLNQQVRSSSLLAEARLAICAHIRRNPLPKPTS